MPFVAHARLGGPVGLAISRAAFSVMVKFSDLTMDFAVAVDELEMNDEELKGNVPN